MDSRLNRRDFIKTGAMGAGMLALGSRIASAQSVPNAQVVICKTEDRSTGTFMAMTYAEYLIMNFAPPTGKRVLIKPNFNSADVTPGSTHNDVLAQIINQLKTKRAASVTIGESSGPPVTRDVMEQKGIFTMAKELGVEVVNFEDLPETGWVPMKPAGSHWQNGFSIPKAVAEAEYVVSTCCLKTHGYGGVFSNSLKLAVGMTPKAIRKEMHAAQTTHMRRMIAELNLGYKPDLIISDAIDVFTDGGPSQGTLKHAGVIIAGNDRVAVDAVGVAVLKDLGSNDAIMGRKIFEQEQIARAVELGLGVSGPGQIELVTLDTVSEEYAKRLRGILDQG